MTTTQIFQGGGSAAGGHGGTGRTVRTGGSGGPGGSGPTYADIQRDSEFVHLRRGFRRFVFPVTVIFLSWYFLYVGLAAFAPDFMGTKVFGNINIGLLLGLGQFVSTFAITMIYVRWADRKFDPTAESLRAHMEGRIAHGPDGVHGSGTRTPSTVDGGEQR